LRTFLGHGGRVVAAGVSPGGRYLVSVDAHGRCKSWDLMRPARCRDLEQRMARAHELLKKNPGDHEALETLRQWYAFRGRDFPPPEPRSDLNVTAAATQ
jgi:hypothetical protein